MLAQGAAQHWVNGGKRGKGVKDLDVWSFYAAIPGTRFPVAKRETHADFGPSELGTQGYDLSTARNENAAAKLRRWQTYMGRRVDLLMRALPVPADAPTAVAVEAVQAWLEAGAGSRATRKPSAWWLARKAMVVIDPPRWRGRVIWGRD